MDIQRFGEMAVRDNVITEERRNEIESFVRDSLPESSELKVLTLKRILNELDDQYDEKIRQTQKLWDELGYLTACMSLKDMKAHRKSGRSEN